VCGLRQEATGQTATATLASDNAAFAFAAYKQPVATNDNLVSSPASFSIALAMTYAGAAGTTASEMASALHFTLPPAQLHPAFNALDQELASRLASAGERHATTSIKLVVVFFGFDVVAPAACLAAARARLCCSCCCWICWICASMSCSCS